MKKVLVLAISIVFVITLSACARRVADVTLITLDWEPQMAYLKTDVGMPLNDKEIVVHYDDVSRDPEILSLATSSVELSGNGFYRDGTVIRLDQRTTGPKSITISFSGLTVKVEFYVANHIFDNEDLSIHEQIDDTVADYDVIFIMPGTYYAFPKQGMKLTDQTVRGVNLDIEGLQLIGPNYNIEGFSDQRGPEAIITFPDDLINTGGGNNYYLFFLTANNMKIRGLMLMGKDYMLNRGEYYNLVVARALGDNLSGTQLINNRIERVSGAAIWLYSVSGNSALTTKDTLIAGNYINNISAYLGSSRSIFLEGSGVIENNEIYGTFPVQVMKHRNEGSVQIINNRLYSLDTAILIRNTSTDEIFIQDNIISYTMPVVNNNNHYSYIKPNERVYWAAIRLQFSGFQPDKKETIEISFERNTVIGPKGITEFDGRTFLYGVWNQNYGEISNVTFRNVGNTFSGLDVEKFLYNTNTDNFNLVTD